MRIEQSFYGDYIVYSELPFNAASIGSLPFDVLKDFNESVDRWPVFIDLNETTGVWELHFLRPLDVPFETKDIEIV